MRVVPRAFSNICVCFVYACPSPRLGIFQMRYWNEVVQETTTFTLPNPDEYERPEEIREIEVNRVKARSVAVEGDALSLGDKLRASLLGQLNEAMADWEDRDLRRSFVHMQVPCTGSR